MGDTLKKVDEVLSTVWWKIAVTVILVILLVVWLTSRKEHYLGDGTVQTNVPFTSGATMRVLSQLPTATDQSEREWVSNSEIKELIPGIVSAPGKKERLVSGRAEPNFFEIGDELSAYQSGETASMRADAASDPSGSERFNSSPLSQVETIELAQRLGTYPAAISAY